MGDAAIAIITRVITSKEGGSTFATMGVLMLEGGSMV
jgi:hypothetical protein